MFLFILKKFFFFIDFSSLIFIDYSEKNKSVAVAIIFYSHND